MLTLFLFFGISNAQNACTNGGWFTTDPNTNECAMECYDGTYIAKGDLSFEAIRDECSNVRNAVRFEDDSECKALGDLVWPSYCSCPYCTGCEAKGDYANGGGVAKKWQQMISKNCYNCTCAANSMVDNAVVYSCEQVSQVYDPYNWDDFTCPTDGSWDNYVQCEDSQGYKHQPSESWWAEGSDTFCDKLCYCTPAGQNECQNGYSAIFASGSDQLKGSFWDDCEWDVAACHDNPALMFTDDIGPGCSNYNCPRCKCPDGKNVGDSWWVGYEDQDGGFGTYADATTCTRCTCVQGGNNNYAQCDQDYSYPNDVGYSCPGNTKINCHEADGYSDCSGDYCTQQTIDNHTLNSVEFRSNQPAAWCSASIDFDDDGDEYWDWGSDNSPLCGIYGANDQCYWYEFSISYTGCYGQTETSGQLQYEYCCNTDDCNFVDIDTMSKSTCTEATQFSALLDTLYQCIYTENGGFLNECHNDLQEEVVTCLAIKDLYEEQANCFCKAYKTIYDDADAAWKTWIKEQIDMFMTSFTEWNDVLNCPGQIICPLDSDDPEIYFIGDSKAAHAFYAISILLSAILGMVMIN